MERLLVLIEPTAGNRYSGLSVNDRFPPLAARSVRILAALVQFIQQLLAAAAASDLHRPAITGGQQRARTVVELPRLSVPSQLAQPPNQVGLVPR